VWDTQFPNPPAIRAICTTPDGADRYVESFRIEAEQLMRRQVRFDVEAVITDHAFGYEDVAAMLRVRQLRAAREP
jgi:hypothetical protein